MPDHDDFPAISHKRLVTSEVTAKILFKLFVPELSVHCGVVRHVGSHVHARNNRGRILLNGAWAVLCPASQASLFDEAEIDIPSDAMLFVQLSPALCFCYALRHNTAAFDRGQFFRHYQSLSSSIELTLAATCLASSGGTAFPICLAISILVPRNTKLSGND